MVKKITNSNIHKIDEKVLEEKMLYELIDALNLINETLKKEYGNKLIVLIITLDLTKIY